MGCVGSAFCWIPSGFGNPGLLLGLLLTNGAQPFDMARLRCQVGIRSRRTFRKWLQHLLRAGAVEIGKGKIRASVEAWRRSPLPWTMFRSCHLRPERKRAIAEVLREGVVSYEADREGYHTDAERAESAGVGRRTIQRARRFLVGLGYRFTVKCFHKVKWWLHLVRCGHWRRTPLVSGPTVWCYLRYWRARRDRKLQILLRKIESRWATARRRPNNALAIQRFRLMAEAEDNPRPPGRPLPASFAEFVEQVTGIRASDTRQLEIRQKKAAARKRPRSIIENKFLPRFPREGD